MTRRHVFTPLLLISNVAPLRRNRHSVCSKMIVLLWGLVLVGLTVSAPRAQIPGADLEREVKGAMLYKFLGYIEWPPEAFTTPLSPYVIAVAGAADMAAELRHITHDRTVNQRPIQIKKVNTKSDLTGVHMLFLGEDLSDTRQKLLLQKAAAHSVVTVTESEAGLGAGGIINFRFIEDRIGFDISLVNAGARRVKLSARLLAVATYVETGGL